MKALLAIAAALWLSGCSTVYVHLREPSAVSPYHGTRYAISEVGRAWREPIIPGEAPVRATLDVPLCLIADTVLLPVDWLIQFGNTH